MKTGALYLRVGLLVLAGLLLAVGFVVYLTGGQSRGGRVYESYFSESVTGLDVGAPVRVRGVQVGRVTEIGLAGIVYQDQSTGSGGSRDGFNLVMVRFSVDSARSGDADTQEMVRRGLRVRLSSQGITGVTYLEMDFAARGAAVPVVESFWTPSYPVIPSVPSTVTQVTTVAEQLVARLSALDVEKLLTDLTAVVGGVRMQIESGDLAAALHDAAGTMAALNELAQSGTLTDTVTQARETLTSLNATAKSMEALVSDGVIRQAVANGGQALTELRTALARLPQVIQSLEATVRVARNTTGDLQADLAPVLRDLRATLVNLRDTTEALRANPAQTLFGNPPPPPGGSR